MRTARHFWPMGSSSWISGALTRPASLEKLPMSRYTFVLRRVAERFRPNKREHKMDRVIRRLNSMRHPLRNYQEVTGPKCDGLLTLVTAELPYLLAAHLQDQAMPSVGVHGQAIIRPARLIHRAHNPTPREPSQLEANQRIPVRAPNIDPFVHSSARSCVISPRPVACIWMPLKVEAADEGNLLTIPRLIEGCQGTRV
jgi:hypothetical protein